MLTRLLQNSFFDAIQPHLSLGPISLYSECDTSIPEQPDTVYCVMAILSPMACSTPVLSNCILLLSRQPKTSMYSKRLDPALTSQF